MWPWLCALLGAVLGFSMGLFGPVAVLVALQWGTGSYEDVLPVWLASLPAGAGLGGWGGYRLGVAWARRRDRTR
jgi:hypothetical protein